MQKRWLQITAAIAILVTLAILYAFSNYTRVTSITTKVESAEQKLLFDEADPLVDLGLTWGMRREDLPFFPARNKETGEEAILQYSYLGITSDYLEVYCGDTGSLNMCSLTFLSGAQDDAKHQRYMDNLINKLINHWGPPDQIQTAYVEMLDGIDLTIDDDYSIRYFWELPRYVVRLSYMPSPDKTDGILLTFNQPTNEMIEFERMSRDGDVLLPAHLLLDGPMFSARHPYMGKRVLVRDGFFTTSPTSTGVSMYIRDGVHPDRLIECRLTARDGAALARGALYRVSGNVDRIESDRIVLTDCKLYEFVQHDDDFRTYIRAN